MFSFHYEKPKSKADSAKYGRGFVVYDDSESPEIMAEIALAHVWSPIIWRDGVRRGDQFLRANWLVLDFDDGKFTLGDATREFKDMCHWIGTTWSHTPEKHKFRVAMRWTTVIEDEAQYRQNVEYALRHYPADRQCKDLGRYFFPCKEPVACAQGAEADVWDKVAELPRPLAVEVTQSRIMPVQVRVMLSEVWPLGTRNRNTFITAKEMFRRGFTKDEIVAAICVLNNFNLVEIERTVLSAERNLRNEKSK
jgi:hypothetical protein